MAPGHLARLYRRDDVDATVAQIEAKGGKALMPAFDIPQGRIAMVADPQGNPFYVMTPIPPAGEPTDRATSFRRQPSSA